MATTALPPPVTWAIRQDVVYVTICVEDCKDAIIDIQDKKIYFKGTGGPDKKLYENTLELYEEVDPEKSTKNIRDRSIDLVLQRKKTGPYWPHLLSSKVKQHWLKVDFSKWRDEDDDEEDDENPMGGMGGMGMPGMGGMGGMPGMGGMGMGGMPGMGDLNFDKPDLGDFGADGDETDSDDDAIPDLE